MALDRPEVPDGFLGSQPQFDELGLQTESNREAEIHINGNNTTLITFRTKVPVKVVTKLILVKTDSALTDYILVQRKNKERVQFHVGFPENGWYKFMLFALEESDPSDSLPNVYNCLINVRNIEKPAQKYVKAYTKFYTDYCFLEKPLVLNEDSEHLEEVKFEIIVPNAEKVAVHCVQEWFHLHKNDGRWEGTANLIKYRGKDSKVMVMANYDKNGNSYAALLEYTI